MATDNIVSLRVQHKTPMTPAERAKAYRDRKKAGSSPVIAKAGRRLELAKIPVEALPVENHARNRDVEPRPALGADQVLCGSAPGPALQAVVEAVGALVVSEPTQLISSQITHRDDISRHVTPVRHASRVTGGSEQNRGVPFSSHCLRGAAFALAGVGIVMNGWFARSLGSTDIAGWLFLAVGVASDCAALAVPSATTRLWNAHQRGSALIGWFVWAATFAFALSASIGFASVNISDVTASRASRVTPAIEAARAQLVDAVTSRDRECKGGVGKFCRERELVVNQRTQALDAAQATVAQAADPQTDSAIKVVTFLTAGTVHPTADDFALVRLILLAFLPQVGGLLLMLARD